MSPLRRTVALIALLAYVALSTVGAGWVVCTAANGHVAIESLAAGCCAEPDTFSAHDDHDHPRDHDGGHDGCDDAVAVAHIGCGDCQDCGDCDDVALSDLTQARQRSLCDRTVLPAALLQSLVRTPAFASVDIGRRTTRDRVPRPPPDCAHLASTRLLL